jgi:hypothetical protein
LRHRGCDFQAEEDRKAHQKQRGAAAQRCGPYEQYCPKKQRPFDGGTGLDTSDDHGRGLRGLKVRAYLAVQTNE